MRSFLVLLAFGAAGYLLVSEVALRGGGARIDGSRVIVETTDLEATFTKTLALEESYMLFGGNHDRHPNLLTDAILAGLPMRDARMISHDYPDFHMCKSAGAKQAQRLVQDLSFVAADRAARKGLGRAIDLHKKRLGDGPQGERTCVTVRGSLLEFDSVKLREDDRDLTAEFGPHLARSSFALAESVEIADCSSLLN